MSTESVTAGWDLKQQLSYGKVGVAVAMRRTVSLQIFLHLHYVLVGAEPNQTYTVGFDIFDLPAPGLEHFGVRRVGGQGKYNREGNEHVVDIFLVGTFSTNEDGFGLADFDLDLSDVPSGTYNLQFGWTKEPVLSCYYRTGGVFGGPPAGSFTQIVIP